MSDRAPHKNGAEARSGREHDWFGSGRRWHSFRAGAAKWLKRQVHKRVRRSLKIVHRREDD